MSILDIIGSVLTGGATGLIGVAVQRVADYANKKLDLQRAAQDHAFELDKRRIDLEITGREWAGREKVAVTETEGAKDVAESAAFAASLAAEAKHFSTSVKPTKGQAWVLVLLDAARGLVRPGLTIYLCAITTLVYLQAKSVLSASLSQEQAYAVTDLIVRTILYLTTVCVLWWFGTRNRQTPPKV
jgi:hypothetical protein